MEMGLLWYHPEWSPATVIHQLVGLRAFIVSLALPYIDLIIPTLICVSPMGAKIVCVSLYYLSETQIRATFHAIITTV